MGVGVGAVLAFSMSKEEQVKAQEYRWESGWGGQGG